MHNKHVQILSDQGWFSKGSIYYVYRSQLHNAWAFRDEDFGTTIYVYNGEALPPYRIITPFEMWLRGNWGMVVIAAALVVVMFLASCNKAPRDYGAPDSPPVQYKCQLQYLNGLYVAINRPKWALLDSVVFTKDETRCRAEFTQQTRANDSAVYYHALSTCDSSWIFSNEGFGIQHWVSAAGVDTLRDSLVIAGVGYGINEYKMVK